MGGNRLKNFKCKLGLAVPFLLLGICLFFAELANAKPATESKKSATVEVSPKKTDIFPEEDSDMLMEPNDFASISVIRSQGQQFFPTSTEFNAPQPEHDSHSQAAQNFYPPFFREIPPLGHSRPYFPIPDTPPQIAKFPIGGHRGNAPAPRSTDLGGIQRGYDASILGSGDFGVIRGGTFYPEEEMPYHHPGENSESINQFFGDNANNGHGRPQGDGFVEKYTYPEEQFANFRDFADINTPGDSAFSQFVVVYAAKNSTQPNAHHSIPKNIFEQLEMLDKEKALEEKKNRISKSKAKLLNTKLEKKYKKKTNPKDLEYEPLLALS